MKAVRDPRVWRGGAVGVVVGHMWRDRWLSHEWLRFERGEVEFNMAEKRRLMRRMRCYHHECGFVNCIMFPMRLDLRDRLVLVRCSLCDGLCDDWKTTRLRLFGFEDGQCVCGSWCHDNRSESQKYIKMKRLPCIAYKPISGCGSDVLFFFPC